eukprot:924682_1
MCHKSKDSNHNHNNSDSYPIQMDIYIDAVIKQELNEEVNTIEYRGRQNHRSTYNGRTNRGWHGSNAQSMIWPVVRYKCSHCTERLESQSLFENHNWFQHKARKPWKYNQCDKAFSAHSS